MRTSRSGARKNQLDYGNIHARLYRGNKPLLRGRIELTRGSGFVEYPDYEQFLRIAREEKVPKELVERAFGHLPRPKRRRTSRKKKRTSRKQGFLSRLLSNPQTFSKRIQRGSILAKRTKSGQDIPLIAYEIEIPPEQATSFGSTIGILVNIDGDITVVQPEEAFKLARRWVSHKQFRRAFGHLLGGRLLPPQAISHPIPTTFGPRSMRLGHREIHGAGPALTGIERGQLVLYHKPSGAIVWQAYDDSALNPDKPVEIWFGANKGHFTLAKAISGAKLGRGDRREDVSAEGRGIPAMAMLEAFDHLLPKETRSLAYQAIAGRRRLK